MIVMEEVSPPASSPRRQFMKTMLCLAGYMIAFFICMVVIAMPFNLFSGLFPGTIPPVLYNILSSLASLVSATLVAAIFLRFIHRLPVSTLGYSIKGRGMDILAGFGMAVELYVVALVILLPSGIVTVSVSQPDIAVLAYQLLFFFIAAAMEEVMMRGYILNRLMAVIPRYWALAFSSLLFAVMHTGNPGIGVLPMVNLFLAGLMLGASYIYTRNLWFPISLHLFWNWLQGPVLGFKVSGTDNLQSVLTLELHGHELITGGDFGFEGSLLCSAICLVATLCILKWYKARTSPTD